MLTKLDSYIKFHKKTNQIIASFDNEIFEIYEIEKEIEQFLEIAEKQKVPGIKIDEKNIYAILYSIMANTKANRSNYIVLKARIEALNDFINLTQYS